MASFIVSLCIGCAVHAQYSPGIEWQKSFGGSEDDSISTMLETTDAGFLVAGYSYSNDGDVSGNHGDKDFWFVKINSAGNMEWQKCLGGTEDDYPAAVQQTNDGGFIAVGSSTSNDGDVSGNHGFYDYWIVKLDELANIEWQKSFGGNGDEHAKSVEQTADGGFIVAGYSYSNDDDVSGNHGQDDYWIIKLSASGNMEWQKCLGGTFSDRAASILQTSEGGFIVAGYSKSNNGDVSSNHGDWDFWVVKLDASGNIEWKKCYGGSLADQAYSIQKITDGFLIVGSSSSENWDVSGNHGHSDYWIVILETSGTLKLQKCLGGSTDDYAASVQQTPDGGYMVSGSSLSNNGDVSGNHGTKDYWVVKLDSFLTIQWQKSLGGSNDDSGQCTFQQTADEEFIVAGSTFSEDGDVSENYGEGDYWIIKLSCDVTDTFYSDLDGDGYGNSDTSITALSCFPPPGYVSANNDCDDTNADTYSDAADIMNGINNNCNEYIDEPFIEWENFFGGSVTEIPSCIRQTEDGGFIIATNADSNDGDIFGNHGNGDYWILKLDSLGNIQWQKCLGGNKEEYVYCIQQTTDGGFIAAGYAYSTNGDVTGNNGNSDAWIVKLDASGNIQWQKSYGGSFGDGAKFIQQTDDGFIVAGFSYSDDGDVSVNHGNSDFWIVKLDIAGNIQWQKSLGGSTYDGAVSALQTTDGAFIVAGYTYSNDGDVSGNHGDYDYWIVRLDSSGNFEWQKCFGGTDKETASAMEATADGGFIVAGSAESNDGDVSGYHSERDYWIVKFDAAANIEWERCFGGSDADAPSFVQETEDGGFIVMGGSLSVDGDISEDTGEWEYWIVKLDAAANIQWEQSFGGRDNDVAVSGEQTTDGGFIIAGYTFSNDGDVSGNNGYGDLWVVKLSCHVTQKFYIDLDGDGYGTSNAVISAPACFPPQGYAFDSTDCDDSNASISPITTETCNGIDDNCNTYADDGLTFLTYYQDTDNDGYGSSSSAGELLCYDPGAGFAASNDDCDDTNSGINPSITEFCNGLDDDCDLFADEGLATELYFADADSDGYGNSSAMIDSCEQPEGYITDSTDCNDASAAVHPGVPEIFSNGIDDNCDGYIDEFATGINSFENSSPSFSFFPNPTKGKFTIFLRLADDFEIVNGDKVTLEIVNVLGEVIYSGTGDLIERKLVKEINLPATTDGIYLIRVIAKNLIYSGKIIYDKE